MKITLVVADLGCGGAERVVHLLSRLFIDRNYEISVVTLDSEVNDFYQLPKEVNRVALDLMSVSNNVISAIRNNGVRLLKVRRAIENLNPDIVISFTAESNVLTLLALTGTHYPVIVTEHSDPRVLSCNFIWSKFRRLTYPYAAKVVSVCKLVDSYFHWLPQHNRAVIYNPFLPVERASRRLIPPEGAALDRNWLVAMGRLSHEKGYVQLLTAFHRIADRHPDWQLVILGEGNLRTDLEALRDHLGLSTQVIFAGALHDPFPVLQHAKLFVSSSQSEAFPMAQGEALSCGLPVIATDCGGPRELIRHGIDGLLVPNQDVGALANAMDHLMSNEPARNRLAERTQEITQRCGVEAIMAQWEALLKEATAPLVFDH